MFGMGEARQSWCQIVTRFNFAYSVASIVLLEKHRQIGGVKVA